MRWAPALASPADQAVPVFHPRNMRLSTMPVSATCGMPGAAALSLWRLLPVAALSGWPDFSSRTSTVSTCVYSVNLMYFRQYLQHFLTQNIALTVLICYKGRLVWRLDIVFC
jgi:hypothetical protein